VTRPPMPAPITTTSQLWPEVSVGGDPGDRGDRVEGGAVALKTKGATPEP
jgi:hypothetical protein